MRVTGVFFFMFRFVHDANANGTGLSRQDDMKHFHGTYKEVCDKHDPDYYAKFKKVSQSVSQPVSQSATQSPSKCKGECCGRLCLACSFPVVCFCVFTAVQGLQTAS